MNKVRNELQEYVVVSKRQEVPGVYTLELATTRSFIPGQYINVYFPQFNTPEGKAYSISSEPGLDTFSITVRSIGEFSNKLCSLEKGDTIQGSLPYGFFNPEREDSELVLLAAGIGITPFRSMVRHIAKQMPQRKVALFHSVRSITDAVYQEELKELQKELKNFSITYFVTREQTSGEHIIPRRMSAQEICTRGLGANSEYLICGSISFVRDMWRDLKKAGVPEDSMYTEAFFSH